MKKLETKDITNWSVAKKTKNIKAKPLISIMVDKNVTNKFLVDTLEGREPLGDGSIICIGESNDVWQQMPKKLLQKYSVIEIDNDGWMICEPKPDNSVYCIEILPKVWITENLFEDDIFYIIGQWGEQTPEGFVQHGQIGDFICQNREDPTDVWIVKRKIFVNTYNIINQ